MIKTLTYNHFDFDILEIKRYAKIYNTLEFDDLIKECISEVENKLSYKVCYGVFDVEINDNIVDFGEIVVNSKDLASNLKGANIGVIFASTIGIEIDRFINKYSKISQTKALIFQAIGAERIETLANAFNKEINLLYGETKPRFSPGYGDFSIEYQREIFKILNCYKNIGLTLNDSLIMSPSKSVTAIIGIK